MLFGFLVLGASRCRRRLPPASGRLRRLRAWPRWRCRSPIRSGRSRSPRCRATRSCCSRCSCGARYGSCDGGSDRGGRGARRAARAVHRRVRDLAVRRLSAWWPAAARGMLLDALGTLVELSRPLPRCARSCAALRRRADESRTPSGDRGGDRLLPLALRRGRDPERLAALRRRCAEVLRASLPAASIGRRGGRRVGASAARRAAISRVRRRRAGDPRRARARDTGVVVASNWDIGLGEAVLDAARAGAALDGIVTSAMVGARKPAAAVFEAALRIAGAGPADALHVGDSLAEDVAGARAAGLSRS